ncbi:sugar phosphate isomerase/epimerase family protein [Caldanaerobius polysaccharolyticus]|uniref:sugar phosphate isomerase/epimerase family protein n=1 Tax=Caldanaerobius polysaccharolyticus TaxID=44256 RepID=UPI00047D0627|nr:sugar phosphate isomerase/epimerase family protein [Caldanaerobius polysaccharolyticus]
MKFGICTSNFDKADLLKDLGYDYLEFSLAGVMSMTDIQFKDLLNSSERSPLKVEAFNSFVRTLKVVGDGVDWVALKDYVKAAMERANALGGKIVVFGSAGARNVPEGYPREKAWNQIADFLRMAGDEAAKYGIYIAIENLNKNESNILNTVEEGLNMVKSVGHSNVKVLADYYHMAVENEGFDAIIKADSNLVHTHIASGTNRTYPSEKDKDRYDLFFDALKDINYNGRVSIEARLTDESDYANAIKVLKRYV